MPFVASPARLDGHYALRKTPVLREERGTQHVHGLNAIHRHGLAEFSGRRIGDIGLIHNKRAALFVGAVDLELAVLRANYSWHERKRIGYRTGIRGQISHIGRVQFVVLGRALFYGRRGVFDIDARAVDLWVERDSDLDERLRPNPYGSSAIFEAGLRYANSP